MNPAKVRKGPPTTKARGSKFRLWRLEEEGKVKQASETKKREDDGRRGEIATSDSV